MFVCENTNKPGMFVCRHIQADSQTLQKHVFLKREAKAVLSLRGCLIASLCSTPVYIVPDLPRPKRESSHPVKRPPGVVALRAFCLVVEALRACFLTGYARDFRGINVNAA